MLVAKMEDGSLFSLIDQNERSELLVLRERERFSCPICQNPVKLKLGLKRRWHFSHQKGKSCSFTAEAESDYHLQGKSLLFKWLRLTQVSRIELEPFLSGLNQRPDILLQTLSHQVALEYQCSTISPELFSKRTSAFQRVGIMPIWILGGNRLKRIGSNMFQISQMDWLAMRQDHINSRLACLYFCPISKQFAVLTHILPYGTSSVFARLKYYPLHTFSLSSLLKASSEMKDFIPENWFNLKQNWRLQANRYRGRAYHYVRKLFGSLSLIPPASGWPTSHLHTIETPCFLWQSWLFHRFVSSWPNGRRFTLQQVNSEFQILVTKRIFQERQFPLSSNLNNRHALLGYLHCLVHLGYLQKTREGYFLKQPDHDRITNMQEFYDFDSKYFEKLVGFI